MVSKFALAAEIDAEDEIHLVFECDASPPFIGTLHISMVWPGGRQ